MAYLLNTGSDNHEIQAGSQDFSKGWSHCVKVRVLTNLSCRFRHLL